MKHLTPSRSAHFAKTAFAIRQLCLEFITCAGWGHIGGSFSEAEFNYHWHTHAPSVGQAKAFLAA